MCRWLTFVGFPQADGASHLVLLAAQLAPLVGIWAFAWGPHELFLLYLVEFVLVGVVAALRIATNGAHRVGFSVDDHGRPLPAPEPSPADADVPDVMARWERWGRRIEKPAAVFALVWLAGRPLPFYLLVGGFFAFEGHGAFAAGRDGAGRWGLVVLALMAVHHAVSYLLHDLRRGERFGLDTTWIVERVHARTFAVSGLWAAAFLGASFLDDPRWWLTLAVAAKAALEVGLHERERG